MTITLKRFLIERDIPGVGEMSGEQLKGLAATSNGAITRLSGTVQWIHSYIAGGKTFCVYLAENEGQLYEHSRIAGFPITNINPIITVIDPMTAYV